MPNQSKAEYKRQWYLRNKARIALKLKTPEHKEKRRVWRAENPEKVKSAWKAWSARNTRGAEAKKWRVNNIEKYREHTRRSNTKTRSVHMTDARPAMLRAARKRAARKNIEFDLVVEDLCVPKFCPVLGIPIVVGVGRYQHGSPTLDRFDNNRGYTKDNTRVISYRANSIKSDATPQELAAVARYAQG